MLLLSLSFLLRHKLGHVCCGDKMPASKLIDAELGSRWVTLVVGAPRALTSHMSFAIVREK